MITLALLRGKPFSKEDFQAKEFYSCRAQFWLAEVKICYIHLILNFAGKARKIATLPGEE